MAIQGVIYQNQKVSAEDHAALFQMFISDGILAGCGMSRLRNVLTINSGMFVLAGRLSKIIGSEQITIPDSIRPAAGSTANVRLTGVIDLNQTASRTEFHQFSFRLDPASNNTYPELRKENINTGNGRYYEVEWAILTIDEDGNITNVEQKIGNSEGTTPSGGGSFISETDFEFSGDPNNILYTSDGTHWEIIILEAADATLTFKKRPGLVDMCLVAAGNNGHGGNATTNPLYGGSGGEVLTSKGTILPQGSYTVTIGKADDAADHDTSIYNAGGTDPLLKALQANGADNGGKTAGQSGGDGSLAFEDDEVLNTTYKNKKYGAGGGIGGRYLRNTSTGQDSATAARGAGGTTGGGIGGISYSQNNSSPGAPGDDNTGSGGGGGFILSAGGNTYYGSGGDGGSGIMFIRDARAAS